MKDPCQAVASSTGAQCKHRRLAGSKYCLLHIEKTPLLLSALVGAILSVAGAVVYARAVPSKESRQLNATVAELEAARTDLKSLGADLKAAESERARLKALVGDSRARLEEQALEAAKESRFQEQQAQAERRSLESKISSLQSSLEPFVRLAGQRFPELSGGEALRRLAAHVEDLDRRFRTTQATIGSFRAEVVTRVTAAWTQRGPTPTAGIMVRGSGSQFQVGVRLSSGDRKELPLRIDGLVDLDISLPNVTVRYELEAPPDSWILGFDSRGIESYDSITWGVYGIKDSDTLDGRLTVAEIEVRFFTNGILSFALRERVNAGMPLPEAPLNPRFTFTAKQPWPASDGTETPSTASEREVNGDP